MKKFLNIAGRIVCYASVLMASFSFGLDFWPTAIIFIGVGLVCFILPLPIIGGIVQHLFILGTFIFNIVTRGFFTPFTIVFAVYVIVYVLGIVFKVNE